MKHPPFSYCAVRAGLLILATACSLAGGPAAAATGPETAAAGLRDKFAAEVEQLAQWCESVGLTDQARTTRRLLAPSDPHKIIVPMLPETVGPTALPANASAELVEWQDRYSRLRRDHAAKLYEIARRAVRNGRAALAFELALLALQTDPDFEPARRLFGYQKFRQQWLTAYEVNRVRSGQVWSERFGWLLKSQLQRYEQGQRYRDGRWISAEEDAQAGRDIRSGWKIETEHYLVHTNHSIEAGVALAVKLEQLNRLWRQMFVRYYASAADVVAMFDGRERTQSSSPRHDVMYFRDRDDYVRSLRTAIPNIDISIGTYMDRPRCAYFFAGEENDDRTLYHEATHQLFHESRPVAAGVGLRANFWIVEAIALYMESLRREDGYYVLGGFDDQRIQAARYRLLEDGFYVPLAELTTYGMSRLQTDPRIAKLYSQSAGLANFLIHYNDGCYRDALVAYLTAVYTGRDTPETLAKLTGTSYAELDKQYRRYLEAAGQ